MWRELKMSHDHEYHGCEHPSLKFCKHCDVVYCKDCKKEWKTPFYQYYTTYTNNSPWLKYLSGTTVARGSTIPTQTTTTTTPSYYCAHDSE